MKTLEVLIPTYNREESALSAIKSVLSLSDDRLGVFCSSNGYSESIASAAKYLDRFRFHFFSDNLGALENFRYLIENSDAEFCMFLSDEDRVDQRGLVELLKTLNNLPKTISFISCAVYDEMSGELVYSPCYGKSSTLSLGELLLLGVPVPTYISGYIFRVAELNKVDLNRVFNKKRGNVYPHLDLCLEILEHGSFHSYQSKAVLKGVDVPSGGDAYAHKRALNTKKNNLDLNPDIYGPFARSLQFFYRNQLISAMRVGLVQRNLALISNIIFFLKALFSSPAVVILKRGESVRKAVASAVHYDRCYGVAFRNFYFYVFLVISYLPCCVGLFFVKSVGNILSNISKRLVSIL